MTSLFDQYEQASQPQNTAPTRPSLSTTGFVNMKLEEETAIFSRRRLNYDPPHPITHLVVANNQVVLALGSKILRRFDLKSPEAIEEIDLSKHAYKAKVHGVFIDPTGQHVLVSIKPRNIEEQPELLYISKHNRKPRHVHKFKGYLVTAIGWCYANTSDTRTGPILLGTSQGLIFETELGQDDRLFQSGLEHYWRQLFDVGKGSEVKLTGLEYHNVKDSNRYFVLATTSSRLYQFLGSVANHDERPLLIPIFNNYLNVEERFLEIHSSLDYSSLCFYYSQPHGIPKTFAWLTEPGIYYGQINTRQNLDSVTFDTKLIPYPKNEDEDDPTSQHPPRTIILTEFHALLVYKDRVKGICVISDDNLVFEDIHSEQYGRLVGAAKDAFKPSTIFAFSERSVFRYKVDREARNIWRIFVEQGNFELAKQYCHDNPTHYNTVLVKQAEYYFKKKEYKKSALYYASTQFSFEECALKFMQAGEEESLKLFLVKKLEHLKPSEKTQSTMIILWVIELYLNRLGILRDSAKDNSSEYHNLQDEFEKFLEQAQVKECVRNMHGTLYKLLASHGDKHSLVHCTTLLDDHEKVLQQHVQNERYGAALQVLLKQNSAELFYKFIPMLIKYIPKDVVDSLIELGRRLYASRLMPAFAMCSYAPTSTPAKEILRYLEHCVCQLDNRDEVVHNYLVLLYASAKSEELLAYLSSQGNDVSSIYYNPQYALRLCLNQNLDLACIHLYTILGMYEDAVDLALKNNIELAKKTANVPEGNEELRKKLWLKIAQHVVKEKNDIKQAMAFLQQCDLIKIEDVVPFFPDFVTIDHFKDAICNSLQEYNHHIEELKEEMEEATKSGETIRDEIQAFRNRYAVVSGTDSCYICGTQLLTRSFYIFPSCGHRFHANCLISDVQPHLTTACRNRLADLQQQLANLSGREETASLGSTSLSARDQIKSDIDDIVSTDCLYCGDIMVRSIDRPFVDEKDYDNIMREWE